MQHFTELGLDVRKARISSDGGWFVDSFNVQEANGKQITSQSKLQSIRQASQRADDYLLTASRVEALHPNHDLDLSASLSCSAVLCRC